MFKLKCVLCCLILEKTSKLCVLSKATAKAKAKATSEGRKLWMAVQEGQSSEWYLESMAGK